MGLVLREIEARSVLNKSKIFDYCLNPYTGCQVGCRYCYAALFMRRYSGHSEPWGEFVDVKVNAPQLLRRQLKRARRGTVWVSSVCDPYQPLEARYGLTRQCLQELLERQFPVNIQTKSHLAVRDLDLFQAFQEIEVGLTITTEDERVARLFEPMASTVGDRLEALDRLHAAGIKTFAFIGPLLPGDPERLLKSLEGKVDRVLIDRLNYVGPLKGFYERVKMKDATGDRFFARTRERLVSDLRRRGIAFECVF